MHSCHKSVKLGNDACTELEQAQPAGGDELGVSVRMGLGYGKPSA
jgi:hypothetical protein